MHEVIIRKDDLMSEIESRSKEFEILLNDLESGQEDYERLGEGLGAMDCLVKEKKEELKETELECEEMRKELDDELEEESNIVGRLAKLKEVERTVLLGIGVKGGSNYLDEEVKERVSQAVGELSALNELKTQMKECKY